MRRVFVAFCTVLLFIFDTQVLAGDFNPAREALLVSTLKQLGLKNVKLAARRDCTHNGKPARCRIYQMLLDPYDAFTEHNLNTIVTHSGGLLRPWGDDYPGWFQLWYAYEWRA